MGCFYCEKGEVLNSLMVKVCELSASDVYLVRNQNYPGRCVVAYKEHKTEIFQLSEEERNAFSKDVALVAKAVYELFEADKINYGIYGDGVPHFHCHIIPKKEGGLCWGTAFDMNANPTIASEEVLQERISLLNNHIKKQLEN